MAGADWSGCVDLFNESQSRYQVIPLLIPDASADSKFLLAVVGGDPPDVMAALDQVMRTWADKRTPPARWTS